MMKTRRLRSVPAAAAAALRIGAVAAGLLAAPHLADALTGGHSTETKLTASDASAHDQFGISVATAGDTIVVGATGVPGLSVVGGDSPGGSAYVFVREGTTWTEQAQLTASDAALGDRFGASVGISGDTIVVGAFSDYPGGSAYVFEWDGTTWTEQAKLTASDAAASDRFGISIAVAGDAVVVGAARNDDAGADSGSAYVFVRDGTTWIEQAKLTASDAAGGDFFGEAVAIAGDTVVVGAGDNDDAGGQSGSAYVFVRDGGTWTEQAKLTASDAAYYDRFGDSVAIAGETVVVGAGGDDDAGSQSGSAYVFVRDGTTWTEQAKLTASDASSYDRFGNAVAIVGDVVVVGASRDDDAGSLSGSAYVFVRDGTAWTEQAKVTSSDAAAGDLFGYSIAIHGYSVVVGASGDDWPLDSGSAYVYEFDKYEVCNGLIATYLGSDGDDVIEGGPGPDVIHGLGGNDVIRGHGGDDVICGGDGNDTVEGNAGNDQIFGGLGNDTLDGGLDSDVVKGEEGNDWVAGGWGDGASDEVHGGFGNDRVFGGDGDDFLWGGGGYDLLYGGDGDDLLQGNHRWDLLRGGPGNDILYGDQQDAYPSIAPDPAGDALFGDEGDDQLFGQNGDDDLDGGADTDACEGGPGTNTAVNCEP